MSTYTQSKRALSRKFPQVYDVFQGVLSLALSERRAKRKDDAVAYHNLQAQLGSSFGATAELRADKTVLFFSLGDIRACLLEYPVIAAFQKAGYEPRMLVSRGTYIRRTYRLFGLDKFSTVDDFQEALGDGQTEKVLGTTSSLKMLLTIVDGSVRVGKYAASSLLRTLRRGNIDLTASDDRNLCKSALAHSISASKAAKRLFEKYDPAAIVMTDRGYTPYGEMFDVALGQGIPVITFNASHKSGEIILKRFGPDNEDRHFLALSNLTWTRLQNMTWSDAKWHNLERYFIDAYTEGDWFAEVGTQFNVENQDRDALIQKLELDPKKKTAIIFAHIFWDATFFYGKDLFHDYEEWLCETLRVAAKNRHVNWIVKVHPANVVKDHRDGATGEHGEIAAIRQTLGELPDHIKLLPANTQVGTLSLFSLMEYCLTVRGTIGIEAASRGIRVLTAGTGRYDGYGFTADFDHRNDYLYAVEKIEDLAPMDHAETELARRYAYGVFKTRSIPLHSVGFGFKRDAKAKIVTWVEAKTRTDLLQGDDVSMITDWLLSGDEDCCQWRADEKS